MDDDGTRCVRGVTNEGRVRLRDGEGRAALVPRLDELGRRTGAADRRLLVLGLSALLRLGLDEERLGDRCAIELRLLDFGADRNRFDDEGLDRRGVVRDAAEARGLDERLEERDARGLDEELAGREARAFDVDLEVLDTRGLDEAFDRLDEGRLDEARGRLELLDLEDARAFDLGLDDRAELLVVLPRLCASASDWPAAQERVIAATIAAGHPSRRAFLMAYLLSNPN